MSEVLNTINHTTLEALGFKYKGEKHTVHYEMTYKMYSKKQNAPTFAEITEDVFEYEDLKVYINQFGAFLAVLGGVRIDATLSFLKTFIAEKKAA